MYYICSTSLLLLLIKRSHHIIYFVDIFFPDTKASVPVVLDLPNNMVEGSAKAFFTVVGK